MHHREVNKAGKENESVCVWGVDNFHSSARGGLIDEGEVWMEMRE